MLSLVLCTVGREMELRRFLLSLSLQTGADWQLYVVDQNSDPSSVDGALGLLGRDAAVVLLRQGPGASKARNAGLHLVRRAGWVLFPDDDSLFPHPTTLSRMEATLDRVPERVGAVCFRVALGYGPEACDIAAHVFRIRRVSSIHHVCLGAAGMAVRAEALREIGGFDTQFGPGSEYAGGEDLDVAMRLIRSGWEVWGATAPCIAHPALPDRAKLAAYTESRGALMRKHRAVTWLLVDMLRMAKNGIVSGDISWSISGPAALLSGWSRYTSKTAHGDAQDPQASL